MQRLEKALFRAALTVKQKKQFGVYSNMTVRQAIDEYGIPARKAVMDELRQLIKLKVLRFQKPDMLDPATLKGILPSKTFVRVKYAPDGAFEKIKERLLGGGHRQKCCRICCIYVTRISINTYDLLYLSSITLIVMI